MRRRQRRRGASGREASGESPPLVLVRTVASRQIVMAVSTEARHSGMRPGMTLAQARALDARVQHAPYEPHRDAAALEALGRWMMRFSPVVSIVPAEETDPAVFLDVTGCERLFDGLENLVHLVADALRRLGISARVALADTPGAAWGLTFERTDRPSMSTSRDITDRLRALPVYALRLDEPTLAKLHHLGLRTVGQVMDLPRQSLPARFGPLLLLRIDQMLGRIAEPLVPLRYLPVIEARIDFDGAVDSLEAIWLAFKELIGRIVTQLASLGRGARVIDVEFFAAYAQVQRQTIRLTRPSRDPVNLFNLLRCALENLETEDGFVAIRLHVVVSEPLVDEQVPLLEHEQYAGESELAALIERLRLKLGEQAVVQAELIESYLPERAWQARSQIDLRPRRRSRAQAPSPLRARCRPLYLLPHPCEVQVMVSPSEDDEGQPVLFRRGRDVHRLRHAVGPERIAGEWWRGHGHTRDYFHVEDDAGRRYWLFRVRASRRWFLHGVFA